MATMQRELRAAEMGGKMKKNTHPEGGAVEEDACKRVAGLGRRGSSEALSSSLGLVINSLGIRRWRGIRKGSSPRHRDISSSGVGQSRMDSLGALPAPASGSAPTSVAGGWRRREAARRPLL